MKKKIMALALCLGIILGTVAEAQKVKIESDSQTVYVTDSISPDSLGVCFIVKKGASIDDDSNVYAVKNAFSDKNGKIEFSFVMPEDKNGGLSDGEYDIYIKEHGKTVKVTDFVYSSLETRGRLINAVKGVTGENELRTILEDATYQTALKAIGARTEYYNADTAKNMFWAVADFSAITADTLKKEYNIATVKAEFAGADKAKANQLLQIISPSFEGVEYSDITNGELTDWVSGYFVNNSYSDQKYAEANILYKFNTSVADLIDDLFAQYGDDVSITQDERYIAYNGLSNKSRVNIKIAESLAVNPAGSIDALLNTVKTAMSSNTTAGGGGGGGAGGGGGSSSKPTPSVTNPIVSGIPTDTQGVVSQDSKFRDMNKAEWAKKAVVNLANAGIVSGDENGNFRPNDYISREEFVTMLVRAAKKYNENASCDFTDVPKTAWFYSYVASASEYGMVHGISEDSFGAGLALTRQDMAVLCLRAKGDVAKVREAVSFADGDEIADYAKDSVSRLYMAGAVNGMGDNKFVPLGNATRAECAQIIYNLFLK